MVQPSAGSPGAAKGGGGGGAPGAAEEAVLGLGPGRGPRCSDVAEKLAQLFGWRHTYKVEKLQRCLLADQLLRQQQLQQLRAGARPAEQDKDKDAKEGVDNNNAIKSDDEVDAKAPDTWVSVQAVSSAEGGLLDPDDRLADVADDRETLTATFEEAGSDHPGQHTGGDGASGSSVGTGSPDIFHGTERYGACGRTDIEVTGEQMAGGGLQLQVRRGSEPALNQLPEGLGDRAPATSLPPPCQRKAASKRWSAAPIIMESSESLPLCLSPSSPLGSLGSPGTIDWEDESPPSQAAAPLERQPLRESHLRPPAYGRFSRDGANRLSMQFLGESAGGLRWCDAAERVAMASLPSMGSGGHAGAGPNRGQSLSLPRDHRRKEPLGQANHVDNTDGAGDSTELVVLRSEAGPLGIHVVPDYDQLGKERGLLVQGIEPGGRVDRDHRLQVYDRIIEINGKNLLNMPFHTVQDIFKDSLRSPELRLRVVKHRSSIANYNKKPPAPVFPRSSSDKENIAMVETEERLVGGQPKVATVSSTKKLPSNGNNNGGPGSSGTLIRNTANTLLAANTRRMGRKVAIDLTKGPHGLGFSITTRDNPAGGNCPIYIKNILPKGAAVEDGRLRPGDRLLEVNGVEMTGKTQAEAVTVLRNAPAGSVVHIVVSRQDDTNTAGSSPQSNYTESSPESSEELSNSPSQPVNSSNESQDSNKSPGSEKGVHITNGYHKSNEKSSEDSLIYPWKHKEILQFDIPVHDTEKAGLGVSVKGKTSANHQVAPYDLGIFVKSVLHGGAASRDGRLRTNDQLLNVNGVSLLNQSNADAMETLRRAMLHTEGPIPGVITLTIARRTGAPSPSTPSNGTKDSVTTPQSIELNGKHEDTCTPDNSGTSENSDNTVIFLPYKDHNRATNGSLDRSIDCSLDKSLDCVSMRNPVLDRLTGQTQSARHNESYYRATHDTSTWNTTALLAGGSSPIDRPMGHLTSPTVNPSNGEMILIEESPTYGTHQHSNRGRRPEKEDSRRPSVSSQQSQQFKGGPPPLQHQQSQQSEQSNCSEPHGDVAYASQLSLDESAAGFSRDAFGRQSMSEKRHATLDAKNTDTYQRQKKLREEREKQKQSGSDLDSSNEGIKVAKAAGMLRANSIESVTSIPQIQEASEYSGDRKKFELGPSLGMKKSSSLESLQTMVQEIQMQEDSDPAYSYRNAQGAVRVIRGRGCNESFRAAVDRSYEAPFASGDLRDRMETLAEEDGAVVDSLGPPPFACARGAPRQSSLNAMDAKNKLGKKKPGLLKGIGSMFRFGKHRKPSDIDFEMETDDPIGDMEAARRAAKDEQQRIQEQYKRLVQRHRQMEEQQQQETASVNGSDYGHTTHQNSTHQTNHHHSHHHHHQPHQQQQHISSSHSHHSQSHGGVGGSSSEGSPGEQGQSRTQRIHLLRAQHQRRHVERMGQYPLDEREERYEQAIQQRVDQPYQHQKQKQPSPGAYDLYGEMTRPGSRMGITDPNQHFSHYVNYDEIQQHLKEELSELDILQMRRQVQLQRMKVEEESRRQQHYHSQRRDNRESHQRPVSNFYEYESVQAMMRANQHRMMDNGNTNSLPRRSPQNGVPPSHGQHSSRPQSGVNRMYPTYVPVNGSLHHPSVNSSSSIRQGPFVTHVTIREASHTPGSKV
ncbi:partitioning defective 3 homolog isoform X2 [Frankliniella occidentalis]|uniref:Partitioning defective 3 homolog isoform X2 n=1 Tax=Frankliniella occidentalis TaxID=133901 RepID=A0A9C6XU23_FRAOC|nr:partitioning defective 3 homolog isoform X2 [Frankliniella occidentalis]